MVALHERLRVVSIALNVTWKEVRKAFTEVGWPRFMTAEFNGDDFLEPEELAKRVDRILAGE